MEADIDTAGNSIERPTPISSDACDTGAISEGPSTDGVASSPPSAEVAPPAEGADPPMSKTRRKKLARAARMKESRKRLRKARKERRRELREKGMLQPRPRKPPLAETFGPHRIAVDLSFDHLMTDKEIRSLASQLNYSYGRNRRAPRAADLYFTGFSGKLEQKMNEGILYSNWKNITISSAGLKETFDVADIVYLTSESPNDLTELDPSKVYVIGGIVDHNRLRGLTYSIAKEQGYAHGRLPISEHLKLASRKVLAVNHVVDILLNYWEHKDWNTALREAMPTRKLTVNERKRKKPSTTPPQDEEATNGSDVA